ncbi:IS3 family transposase, partial [Corynebacterium striatum]
TQHQRIVVPPTSTMKENPLQYRVRGTPVPTTRTRGTNYPKSTMYHGASFNSVDEFCQAIDGYILWYNTTRLQEQFKDLNHLELTQSGKRGAVHLH